MKPYIGAKVTVTDGSSDGHTGKVIAIWPTNIRIVRDADGIEVDVVNYFVHRSADAETCSAFLTRLPDAERQSILEELKRLMKKPSPSAS